MDRMSTTPTAEGAHHADVIIVGAGPAGLSTALHLAQRAPGLIARTLILEKATHPRHKLCGGGILPDGERILAGLGLDLGEIPHCDVDWAHFDYARQGMRLRAEPERDYAFRTIQRSEFDAWLAGKARALGFQIHEGTQVNALRVEEGGVWLDTNRGRYHACVVVGADGSNSLVRRAVAPPARLHTARTLEVVTGLEPSDPRHKPANSYFDFFVVPLGIQGYVWDFPALADGKPVRVRGIFDRNEPGLRRGTSLPAALGEEFAQHGLDLGSHRLEGFPIHWFDPRSPLAAPRLLLAGDAAGSDALYGEGISLALGYGRLAAAAIHDALEREDYSFRRYKPMLLRSALGRSLWWRTTLAWIFYRLHPAPIQAFIWRRLGGVIAWLMRRLVIGWARRQERRERTGRA
jgi:flavin-dependent dehydrogenase